MIIKYLKSPLNKYTFKSRSIRQWVESHCEGKSVLNLFSGITLLSNCIETRNDIDNSMQSDYHMDALDFVMKWKGTEFDVVLLDPPYSYRKSMEMYNGHKASRFNQVKDHINNILKPNGKVITFGYQSVSMGINRGYTQTELLIISHGGAIHDTIATVETKSQNPNIKQNDPIQLNNII